MLGHPAAWRPTVETVSESEGVRPSMIWAIMQRESAYDPAALSPSDAMGLMQVIPQTAQAIADELGERYTDGMLFEPQHSIRYGGWYLGALLRKFGGQIPLAVVAYNAGPLAVESWLERNSGVPLDEFVEEIGTDQARDYMRNVLSTMVRYELVSGSPETLDSPTIAGIFPDRLEGGYLEHPSF